MIAPTGPLCTTETIAEDLRAAGVEAGETLLVHSSLRSLGWVAGGAVAVVQALLEVLGPHGTLVVPTLTADNSDPAGWSSPPVPRQWWPAIRASMPAYDPLVTPSTQVGVIPESVRTWPGALRSAHPRTSFAAVGAAAAELTSGHAVDCKYGEQSPLARLERAGARVLLLGTGFDTCTCFHLAEYRITGAVTTDESFAVMTPQGRQWTTVRDTATNDERFGELGEDFARDRPVRRGTVGAAATRLFPLADAVAYAQRWLSRT
ncbi:aminoglycoside N(3)-acetyltransferase [Kibdelosporangium phytohabitans]|uniref:Aminoglycoside N(3)-acetyltransferase n=1 Tax=Kibdelosporangium phytohabitans TaxID=860235 RepID=A0A0N9I259_9PSEU|nr:AAC(3) family N-acetyltransferase [Kibdelosporangium phytohabitans]ALG08530.1 aminoglycoside phosphotransferase [Kibdelosporangium phytohabitans]MBE1470397.1 aminoglycoside 3-N-acetyltransferase [Kibdelosporangium phytohabitans]